MILDIIVECANRLHIIAPSAFGNRKRYENESPPRIVWMPRRKTYQGRSINKMAPRSLYDQMVTIGIACWGRTFVETDFLERSVITVLRNVVGYGNLELDICEYEQPEWLTKGQICSLDVRIRLPLLESTLVTQEDTTQVIMVPTLVNVGTATPITINIPMLQIGVNESQFPTVYTVENFDIAITPVNTIVTNEILFPTVAATKNIVVIEHIGLDNSNTVAGDTILDSLEN